MSPRKRNVGRHSMGADIERIRKSPELRGTTLAELVLEIDALCPGEDPCAKKGERCTCDFWLPLGWWERLAEAARAEVRTEPVDSADDLNCLELSVRATNALEARGLRRISELVKLTREQLRALPNMNPRAVEHVVAELARAGLTLAANPGGPAAPAALPPDEPGAAVLSEGSAEAGAVGRERRQRPRTSESASGCAPDAPTSGPEAGGGR